MNNAITTYNNSLVNSFDAYLQRAYSAPLLTAEEEHELACKFYNSADKDAAHKLVFSHIKFVAKIARNYQKFGCPLSDLVQEGTVGLMKAVRSFNPHHGVRLASFAMHWIKAEIHEYILKNWSLVKIATTKAQRKIFFNIHKFSKQTKYFSNEDIADIASFLKVDTKDVAGMVQRLSHQGDMSTDIIEGSDNILSDQTSNHALLLETENWQQQRAKKLTQALSKLDERSQMIIKARWLTSSKASLKELAEQLNVSLVRVGQIEKLALKKLKQLLDSNCE